LTHTAAYRPVLASFLAMSGISRLPGAEKNSTPLASKRCWVSSSVNACLQPSVMSVCHAAWTYAIFLEGIGVSPSCVWRVVRGSLANVRRGGNGLGSSLSALSPVQYDGRYARGRHAEPRTLVGPRRHPRLHRTDRSRLRDRRWWCRRADVVPSIVVGSAPNRGIPACPSRVSGFSRRD